MSRLSAVPAVVSESGAFILPGPCQRRPTERRSNRRALPAPGRLGVASGHPGRSLIVEEPRETYTSTSGSRNVDRYSSTVSDDNSLSGANGGR